MQEDHTMMTEDEKIVTEDFECVDPQVGEHYLHGYVAESLSREACRDFENHVVFCHKCQEDLAYLRWATQQLKDHWTPDGLTPLVITALHDDIGTNLLHHYAEAPLVEQLAASTETGAVRFPFTLTCADGQVSGQFLKRAGHLFFRLQKSAVDCTLIYRSPLTASELKLTTSASKMFTLAEGEDKRLGAFDEFVAENTTRGILEALKRFQLFMKSEA